MDAAIPESVPLRARAIPGQDPARVRGLLVRTIPARRLAHLSIDEASVARGPIVRGRGPPYLAAARGGRRVRVVRQEEQRRDFLPAAGPPPTHVSRFRDAHPGRRAVAVTGCGNLGLNPGTLARAGGCVQGVPGPSGGAVRVRPDGSAEASAWPPPDGTGFTIAGPLLVRAGRAVPIDPRVHPDPRHLLLFAYVEAVPGVSVDAGLDDLVADPALYARAAGGDPVALPLRASLPAGDDVEAPLRGQPLEPAAARAALLVKGYRESPRVREPGTFRIDGDRLEIAFLPGIYPHHALAVWSDGAAASVLATGLSNRAGVALREFAEDLAAAGAAHAVLLDNGGDVGLLLPEEDRFEVRPAEADRAGRWPTTATLIYHEPR